MQAYTHIYFIGIGGIGMSAIARFYNLTGYAVAGYDRTPTPLTQELENEGIAIHYTDDINLIADGFKNPATTLVVYTPAIPKEHTELNYFIDNKFTVIKRSAALGQLTHNTPTIAVAGTHGKTTTSSMVAHILKTDGQPMAAFLGGITVNYNTNILLPEAGKPAQWIVTEADEYDRSFLTLHPKIAIITSADADHLDIYGTPQEMHKSFVDFAKNITPNGLLIVKNGLTFELNNRHYFIDDLLKNTPVLTYSITDEKADYRADNVRVEDGVFVFDLITPNQKITEIKLAMPGTHNVENSVAAAAAALNAGCKFDSVKTALETFKGAKRRFEYIVRTPQAVYIDDYAHHPTELEAAIQSVKMLFPGKKITGIFQPHLFTRTRDFAEGFAQALDKLDECILLPIYPARELPIAGVTSDMLLGLMQNPTRRLSSLETVVDEIATNTPNILVTLGAGNIDTLVEPLKNLYTSKFINA